MRNHTETGAGRVALVGVLAALSLIALYLSAVSPTARMGIVAIAGLFPAGAVVSAGLKAGFFCYGAAGLLGLLLYRYLCQQAPIAPICFKNGSVLTQYGRLDQLNPTQYNVFYDLSQWAVP